MKSTLLRTQITLLLLALPLSVGAAGWNELPNTALRPVCPPNNFGGYNYEFRFYCKSVTSAWNGGAYDSKRHQMYIWGGGHGDYFGNEIYALQLNDQPRLVRLTEPALPLALYGELESELAPFDGTQPQSRHTYDGMVYMEHLDRVWAFSGSLAYNGGPDNVTWLFDPNTNTWQRVDVDNPPKPNVAVSSAYDPVTQKVFMHNRVNLYSFEYADGKGKYQVVQAGIPYEIKLHPTAVIDPIHRKFVVIGAGHQLMFDIDGKTPGREDIAATGDTEIIDANGPGAAYDPSRGLIVTWAGGDTVYTLDLGAKRWQSYQFPGGPSSAANGTYGRWAYDPRDHSFVTYNHVDANANTFSLPPSARASVVQGKAKRPAK